MVTQKREYKVNHQINTVKEVLVNLTIFGRFHPLIKAVDLSLANNHYRVREQPFNALPITINYTCAIVTEGSDVKYQISGIPILNPYLVFRLTQVTDSETLVACYIRVSSVPIFASLLLKKMFAAQEDLWAEVNNTLPKKLIQGV